MRTCLFNMSKYRQAAKVDANQSGIVKQLRSIPGVTVAPGHDDILIGWKGQTFWMEIKDPAKLTKDGRLPLAQMKPSQIDLLREWKGQYNIVSDIDEILQIMGINRGNHAKSGTDLL